MIAFTVFGKPMQRGSKTPWLPRKKDGSFVMKNWRPLIATMDSNKSSKDWMAQVRQVASEHFSGELIRGAVRVSILFYFARPKAHFRSGKNAHLLKDDAPRHHTQTPDCDKLTRCLADALTGVVFTDDSQICVLVVGKHWTTQQARAEVVVESLE